jgi:hypothetical protein
MQNGLKSVYLNNMGIESEFQKSDAQKEAYYKAIEDAEVLLALKNKDITVPFLHPYDKVSSERIDRREQEISISGRGVYSLFKVDGDTRTIVSDSYSSLDDTQEEKDKIIHLQRLELIKNKFQRE